MFLSVQQPTKGGGECTRLINIDQIVTLGPADGAYKDRGFSTVLFTPNGYAMYSTKTVEEIISAANLKVIQ